MNTEKQYFSQYHQDRWLDENIFKGKRDGILDEAGAFDGETHSNTAFFERERGWTGICIEPQAEYFQKLSACRDCVCVHAALATKAGPASFLKVEGHGAAPEFSGLRKTMSNYQIGRIRKKVKSEQARTKTMVVGCLRLDHILVDNGIEEVDYLSLDMEGGELDVLRSLDLQRFKVHVVGIENNEKRGDIAGYMQKQGYGLVTRLAVDEIYERVT